MLIKRKENFLYNTSKKYYFVIDIFLNMSNRVYALDKNGLKESIGLYIFDAYFCQQDMQYTISLMGLNVCMAATAKSYSIIDLKRHGGCLDVLICAENMSA